MKNRRILSLLMTVIMLLTCITPAQLLAAEEDESVFTEFVTRAGDKLMEGGNELRFISANVPTLLMVEDVYWHVPDPWEQEDAIKAVKQMGGKVIRTYVLSVKKASDTGEIRHVEGPSQFNEQAFIAMDKALQLANQYGIRLIIPFVDEYSWQGGTADYAVFRGKTKSAFYSDEQVKADFKATINYVLNRVNTFTGVAYKDDKAILAWETGNELVPPSQAWTHEMAAYIKSIDANHLVADGKYGIDTASLTDDTIDIVSNHYYPDHYPDYADQCATDRTNTTGKKPFIIGEFGFVKPDQVESLLDNVIENGTAGAFIWSLRFHNKDGGFYPHTEGVRGGDFYCSYRWPGFPAGDSYYETQTLTMMRDKAYEVQGITAEPPIEAPDAPIMLPIDSVSAITWKGSTGAEGYDVLRSTSSDGIFLPVATDFSFTLADPQYFNDTSAVSGETYYYSVVAKNSSGTSAMSNVIGPVVANHAIIDNINGGAYYVEWGKLYDYSTDLAYTGSNMSAYHNDYFRLKQLSTLTQQYVSYALPHAAEGHVVTPDAFSIETYFDTGVEADFTIQVSSDDLTYENLTPDVHTTSGAKTKVVYTGTLPEETKYVNILFPAEASAQLGKVTLGYVTDGGSLTFPEPKKGRLVEDGKIIDEMNNTLKIFDHEGNLGFETGDDYGYYQGDLKRLKKSSVEELTSFTYKAGGDMNYFKMTAFIRQDNGTYQAPKFKIYAGDAEEDYTEITDYSYNRAAVPQGGWWNQDDYIIYSLPEDTRFLKVEFPDLTGSMGTWVLQVSKVEIGVGSATIPPPADPKTDTIDDFDGYSGSNSKFREKNTINPWGADGSITLSTDHKNNGTYGLAFIANLNVPGPNGGTGFFGYDMSIANADWSGKSGIQLWLDPNGQTMPLELQFQEASSNEQWKYSLTLTGDEEAGIIEIPFSSFARNDSVWNRNPADPKYNGTIDLDAINTFGIYTNGSASHTLYLDSIGLYLDNAIDRFETYADDAALQEAYTPNGGGDSVTAALDSTNKSDGSYGMEYAYTIGSKGFCGLEKNMNHADWTGTNGIELWLKPDGSNRNLSVQFKEASGDYWKAQLSLSGTEGRLVQIPYSSFFRPDWQGGSATIELNDIVEFGLYVDGAQGSSSIYFDSITPAKMTGIENFDFYNGNNTVLGKKWTINGSGCPITVSLDGTNKNDGISALKYDYDVTATNWGGITKALPKMDWTGKNAISLWVKGDGSNRRMTVQFKENSGEYFEASFDVNGSEPKIVTIPLASFARPSWCSTGNNTIDLNEITELSFNIDRGPSGAGTGTLYLDSVKLTDIPIIDDFDNYDGGELVAKHVYVPNIHGGTVTMTPDGINKNEGKYGINFQYTLGEKSFAGATKNLNGMSWAGADGLTFWYKPDGTNNKLVIQFKEPNQEAWETSIILSETEAQTVFIPFADFAYPSWYSGGSGANGEIDLEAISEFSIYVNLVDGGTEGTHSLYFDSIAVTEAPEDNDTVIDEFEDYENDEALREVWGYNADASPITVTLTSEYKNQGSYGMEYQVTFNATGYAELSKTLNHANWTGRTGIEFWVDTLDADGPLDIYITEASGERWKTDNWMSKDNNPGYVRKPFSSFYRVFGPGNNQLDLADIVKIDLDPWGNNGSSRHYYLDSIGVYGDTLAPTTPAGVTVTGNNALSISLSWNASTDNTGVTGYEIYRDGVLVTTTTGLSCTDTVEAEDTYVYTIRAYDGAGNFSEFSTPLSVDALMHNENNSNTIDMFEDYASDASLQSVWTYDSNASPVNLTLSSDHKNSGNYGIEYEVTYNESINAKLSKTLNNADWTGKTGIEFWIDTLGTPGALYFHITEASGESWVAEQWIDLGNEPGYVQIPFSSFTKDLGEDNDILDLADVVQLDIVSWGLSGTGRHFYLDSFKVYPLPGIDSFEYNDDAALRSAWTYSEDASPVEVTLSPDHKNEGAYGMKYRVTYNSSGYSELSKSFESTDWSDQIGIEYWVDTLGADGPLDIYITEASGERWKANNWMMGAANPGYVRVPFYQFSKVYGVGNDLLDLDAIVKIDLDSWGNSGSTRTYYIDSLDVYGDTQPPSIPANITVTENHDRRITLVWDASTDDFGIGHYELYRDDVLIYSNGLRTFTDTVPRYGTNYTYKLRAMDESGNHSDFSAPMVIRSAYNDNETQTPAPSATPVVSNTGSGVVKPEVGGSIGLGTEATVQIPAGALAGSAGQTITVETKDETEEPSGFKALGKTYTFNVGILESYTFKKPVTLTFAFDPHLLAEGEVPSVFYYDVTLARWVRLGGRVQGNKIIVEVDHFTDFTIFSTKLHAFPDVSTAQWGYEAIKALDALGVTTGYRNGNFGPNDKITRAEFSTLISKALQLPSHSPAVPDFLDVKPTDWFYRFVESAYKKGMIYGSNGKFNPTGYITREQLLVILMNCLGKKADAAAITSYDDDALISSWARPYVKAAEQEGLVHFIGNGNTLSPQSRVTRAEACQLIFDLMKKQK